MAPAPISSSAEHEARKRLLQHILQSFRQTAGGFGLPAQLKSRFSCVHLALPAGFADRLTCHLMSRYPASLLHCSIVPPCGFVFKSGTPKFDGFLSLKLNFRIFSLPKLPFAGYMVYRCTPFSDKATSSLRLRQKPGLQLRQLLENSGRKIFVPTLALVWMPSQAQSTPCRGNSSRGIFALKKMWQWKKKLQIYELGMLPEKIIYMLFSIVRIYDQRARGFTMIYCKRFAIVAV